ASLPGCEMAWSEPTMPALVDAARTPALRLEPFSRPGKSRIQCAEQFVRGRMRTFVDLCQAVWGAHCNKIVVQAIAVAQAARHDRTRSRPPPGGQHGEPFVGGSHG